MKVTSKPDTTRVAILRAALEVFSREGAAGARTETIAKAAGVNKALLYYYFKDKDALLAAVLEHAFSINAAKLQSVLESGATATEKLLNFVSMQFELLASRPDIVRLIHYELLRATEGDRNHLPLIAERFQKPLMRRIENIVREGIEAGEFRDVDPRQTVLSLMGLNVSYFLSAPALRQITGQDPLAPKMLAQRKASLIDFISHALLKKGMHR